MKYLFFNLFTFMIIGGCIAAAFKGWQENQSEKYNKKYPYGKYGDGPYEPPSEY